MTDHHDVLHSTPNFYGFTYASGDFVSLFSLFFDNLSTLLGLSSAILMLNPNSSLLRGIVYHRIIPAAGMMLFLGNAYYTYQAIRMRNKFKKPYTAQPYGTYPWVVLAYYCRILMNDYVGLNTTGGFPFVFGIIYGVYYANPIQCTDPDTGCDPAEEENNRIIKAWQVCVAANFLTGVINIVLGFFGPIIMNIFPIAAMLVPLAGIGFTWLALNQIAPNFETPAIGLIPVFLIFTQYYGFGRFHIYGKFYMPEALPIVIFGIIAGWAYGLNKEVAEPVKAGIWVGDAFIKGFSDIGDYMGIVLPFSIAASFGDMMVLVSAQKAGDPYPIRETMISDGIGTLVGAILGAPFGTVIYIGHPIHKRVGAQTGFSLMNGTIYLILCTSGIVPVILTLVPAIAIGPIILIFGLMTCEECTHHIHQRHHAAIFFGLFFGIADYIYTNFRPEATVNGINAMSKGSALCAMFWAAIIVMATDRRWTRCAIFCVVAGAFAGTGIIHQNSSFKNFTTGFQGINNSSPMQFMCGYFSMAGVCLIYHYLQTSLPKKLAPDDEGYDDDHGYLPPITEAGVDRLFDTWWEPALNYNADNSLSTKKTIEAKSGFDDNSVTVVKTTGVEKAVDMYDEEEEIVA